MWCLHTQRYVMAASNHLWVCTCSPALPFPCAQALTATGTLTSTSTPSKRICGHMLSCPTQHTRHGFFLEGTQPRLSLLHGLVHVYSPKKGIMSSVFPRQSHLNRSLPRRLMDCPSLSLRSWCCCRATWLCLQASVAACGWDTFFTNCSRDFTQPSAACKLANTNAYRFVPKVGN